LEWMLPPSLRLKSKPSLFAACFMMVFLLGLLFNPEDGPPKTLVDF
jgi:hypothetical protein